jgi:histidine ammonia-lyase
LLRPLKTSACLEAVHCLIREKVKKLENDRAFYEDYSSMDEVMSSQSFQQVMKQYIN